MRRASRILLGGMGVLVLAGLIAAGLGFRQMHQSEGLSLAAVQPWLLGVVLRQGSGASLAAEDLRLRRSPDGEAELSLRNLVITAADGREVIRASRAAVDLDLWHSLVERAPRIERLTVIEAALTLVRDVEGQIALRTDGLQAHSLATVARPAASARVIDFLEGVLPETRDEALAGIAELRLEHARIAFLDAASGQRIEASDGTLTIDPARRRAEATLTLDGRAMLRLGVTRDAASGFDLALTVTELAPADLALILGQPSLAAIDRRFSGDLTLRIARDSQSWPLALSLTAANRLAITGQGEIRGSDGHADLTVNGLGRDDLLALWPNDLATAARDWVAANVTAAVVSQGKIAVSVTAGQPTVGGSFAFTDTAVRFLAEAPAATELAGEASFDGSRLTFQVAKGRLDSLALRAGTVDLTGLDRLERRLEVAVELAGPIVAALAVGARIEPRLRSTVPRSAEASGDGVYRLKVGLPLVAGLSRERIEVGLDANLVNAGLPKMLRDQDLSDGQLAVRIGADLVEVSGTAKLGGLPIEDLTFQQSLVARAEPVLRLSAKGILPVERLALLGITAPAGFSGAAGVDLTWQRARSGAQRGKVALELTPLAFARDSLPIAKRVGQAGRAEAAFALNGSVLRLTELAVTAPGLAIKGGLGLDLDGPALVDLDLAADQLAGSRLVLTVSRPDRSGYRARLSGSLLDLRPWLAAPAAGGGTPPAFDLSLELDTLLIGRARLTGVAGTARHDGQVLRSADARAGLRGGQTATLTLEARDGQRHLKVSAPDAGALLEVIDPLADQAQGGSFNLQAVLGDRPDAPLIAGKIVMRDFTLTQAPAMAQILTLSSLTGIANTLQGNGIHFERAKVDFELRPGSIRYLNGKAVGSQLGITAQGANDLRSGTIDLTGTVVPMYSINSLLGKIPLVGQLLRGKDGIGAFAATYSVTGPQASPQVSVNPLSVVVPGFIRDLGDLLSGSE